MAIEGGKPSEPSTTGTTASPEKPEYRKQKQDDGSATALYMIIVDEGWREWPLCNDMFEWAADQLIRILREVEATWPH